MLVQAEELFRFEQEVVFDGYLFGTTDSYPNGGQIEIREGSAGLYWDGVDFIATPTLLPTTVDSSGLFHYYDFAIPAAALNGQTYNMRMRISDDAETESVGTLIVRPASGGGGGSGAIAIFDAVDFTTGFPSTVGFT